MIFVQPVERIVNEEIANRVAFRTVVVDAIAPWSVMAVGKKLRSIGMEIVPLRPKVVVNDIEQNHDAVAVCALNELFQIFRPAVITVGSKRQDSVVTPISSARKVRKGHQFENGDAEIGQVVELVGDGGEGAFRRKGSHVQFVNHSFFPRAATPVLILPVECLDRKSTRLNS